MLQNPANRAAIRTAFAVLLALYLAFFLHFDDPYWAGMTVILINHLYVADVLSRCILRIVGTAVGVIVGGALAIVVANTELYYFIVIFVIVVFSTYRYHTSAYGYAYIAGALGAVLVLTQLSTDINQVFYVMWWRFAEISVGVLSLAICSVYILPNPLPEGTGKQKNIVLREPGDLSLLSMSYKMGLIACLSLGLWMHTDWPGGYIGIVSALVLSMRQNEHEHQNAAAQRLTGCFFGGALVLFFLMFKAFNFYDLTICLFLGVLFFSLILFRHAKWSYFGMQANIAFVIALSFNGQTPYLISPIFERIGGMALELMVSMFVFSKIGLRYLFKTGPVITKK